METALFLATIIILTIFLVGVFIWASVNEEKFYSEYDPKNVTEINYNQVTGLLSFKGKSGDLHAAIGSGNVWRSIDGKLIEGDIAKYLGDIQNYYIWQKTTGKEL